MKAAKRILAVALFTFIFALIFSYCDRVLVRKSTDGWWNVTAKTDGFYNSPKNEYEVMFFGSSNAYCSFNPLTLWKETGVKSYVLATQQQPIWATYHYMKDAFKTQHPKLAVVDILMISKNDEYYDDGVNYTFCDNMPLSENKIRLAMVSAPKGERAGLLCRFIKYHSRWSELTEEDFSYRKSEMSDFSKGFCTLTSINPDAAHFDVSKVTKTAKLSEKNEKYLYKIIELCRENGIELMLVKTPSNCTEEEKSYYNSVMEIAEAEGVDFVDYNLYYDEIGLDMKHDFFDTTHLNIYGADKFTRYFKDTVGYFENRVCGGDDWNEEYDMYSEMKKVP